jgi:hypothetical protein
MKNYNFSEMTKPAIFSAQTYGTKTTVEIDHSDLDLDKVMDTFQTLLNGMGYHSDEFKQWVLERAAEYREEEDEKWDDKESEIEQEEEDEKWDDEESETEQEEERYENLRNNTDDKFDDYQNDDFNANNDDYEDL